MASAHALAPQVDRSEDDAMPVPEELASESATSASSDKTMAPTEAREEEPTAEGKTTSARSGHTLRTIEGEAGTVAETAIHIESLNLFYGEERALKDISMEIPECRVTAFIGPSGCGKSSLLRCINRMNDLVPSARVTGAIRLGEQDIHAPEIDVPELRRRVGMVFQKPNPFPKSIYENVAYGLRIQGVRDRKIIDAAVENSLRKAALWEEVKDRLEKNAYELSGGQQQRLVIARAIAIEPEILLLDEPASALDPISTTRIENLIEELREEYTIVIVTHNMQQAARISDYTAFLYMGELIEFGDTAQLFTNPDKKQTEDYITGKFG